MSVWMKATLDQAPCHDPTGGSDILLCYQCDTRLSTTNAMSTAMQLIHDRFACSCPTFPFESQSASKLYPNTELSPTEKVHISNSLSDLQHLLDRHNFELARLRDVISFLSISQEALARRMEDVRALYAPINSLPDEILAEILRMHFLEQMEEVRYRSYGRIRIPLGFTRVCKRWHEVALSSPSIWSDVTAFGDIHFSSEDSTFVRNLTRMFLSRSRCAPLGVKLVLSTSQVPTKSSSRVVAPLLLAQSTRWGRADLDIDLEGVDNPPGGLLQDSNDGPIAQGLHGEFPLLKSLALGGKFASLSQRWRWGDLSELDPSMPLPKPVISLGNASLLSHLTLNLRDSLSPTEMVRAIDLPWHQIRTLKCNYSFGNLESLLRLCTNVEEVEVNAVFRASGFRSISGQPTNTDNPISEDLTYTCASLKRMSLKVSLPSCQGVRGLLKHLRAPALASLDLTFIPSSTDSFSAAHSAPTSILTFLSEDLVSFFTDRHGSNQLAYLAFHNLPKFKSCSETLISLFRHTLRLEELKLEFQKVSQPYHQDYIAEDPDLDDSEGEQDSLSLVHFFGELRTSSLLPALTNLRLSHLDMSAQTDVSRKSLDLEMQALFDMLETRREGRVSGNDLAFGSIIAPLEKIYLDGELVRM